MRLLQRWGYSQTARDRFGRPVVSVALARRPVRGHNVLPGSAGVLRVDVGVLDLEYLRTETRTCLSGA